MTKYESQMTKEWTRGRDANRKRRSPVRRGDLPAVPRLSCYVRSPLLVRNVCKNESPCVASDSSSFFVQSQSQQAHGSVPFSCRQLRRECASFTLSNSKYSSQYGRSSASG